MIERDKLNKAQEKYLELLLLTPPGSERFKLSTLNLGEDEKFVDLTFGKRKLIQDDFKNIRILNLMPQSAEEYKIDPILFNDEIDLFNNFLKNCHDSEIKKCVLTSLYFYSFVRSESEFIDINKKIVFFVTAFEALLKSPDQNSKEYISQEINDMVDTNFFINETRKDKRGKPFPATKIAFKIRDYYDLRSDIVHGKKRNIAENEFIEHQGTYPVNTLMILDLIYSYILLKTILKHSDFSNIKKNYYETPFINVFSKLGYVKNLSVQLVFFQSLFESVRIGCWNEAEA